MLNFSKIELLDIFCNYFSRRGLVVSSVRCSDLNNSQTSEIFIDRCCKMRLSIFFRDTMKSLKLHLSQKFLVLPVLKNVKVFNIEKVDSHFPEIWSLRER